MLFLDNHDILSVKMYEIEYARAASPFESAGHMLPSAEGQTAPRDNVVNPPPSNLSTWAKYLLILIGAIATSGGIIVFGYLYYQVGLVTQTKNFTTTTSGQTSSFEKALLLSGTTSLLRKISWLTSLA